MSLINNEVGEFSHRRRRPGGFDCRNLSCPRPLSGCDGRKGAIRGQITITAEVVNYPGVERFDLSGDIKTVGTSRGELRCFGVLLATGAHPRMVGFPVETEFRGKGVAYCATCDGEFFTGKDVFVVGGGFAAADEAVFLTRYARSVTILIREPDFTCAKATADAALT